MEGYCHPWMSKLYVTILGPYLDCNTYLLSQNFPGLPVKLSSHSEMSIMPHTKDLEQLGEKTDP